MPISGPICCGTRCHIPISGGSTTAMAIESKASKNHAVQMISRIFRCHEQYGRRSSRATTWRMSPRSFEAAAPVMVATLVMAIPRPRLLGGTAWPRSCRRVVRVAPFAL